MNYEEKSAHEINREVASHFYCPNWLSRHDEKLGMIPDYCNNPSDAWPIIVENKIGVTFLKAETCVVLANNGDFYARSRNPLRAAMICFLKMKDAENGR